MQEKNISHRNISKKKSENIKIPTKIHEKMKENNNNILPSYKCNCNNNYSNNNSILINKSNVKIDIGNNYKGTNLRSISHSTKCMMKIKAREKDKDKDINFDKDKCQPKINSKNKNKSKYSAKKNYTSTNKYKYHYSNNIKDIKGDKSNKSNKSKRHKNTEDIFIYKSHNSDLNNHSFNYLKNYQNSNSSVRNIESFNDYSNFNKSNNKIQKIKKNEDNINCYNYNSKNSYKNNFVLPFYYCVKKGDKKYNFKKKINYSNKGDYYNIIQKVNSIPISELATKIVGLAERKWMNELKINLAILENRKSINSQSNILNEFIKERLNIQEDFNWLLWAISYVFQNKIFIDKSDLKIDEDEINANFNNADDINIILSVNDINKWKEGFIYNGIYFCLLDKIENYKEIKIIKREIKSLNLLFLDYIQLLDNFPASKSNNELINSIIFPLLSLAEISNYFILGSIALEPSFEEKNIKNSNLNEEGNIFNYYNEVDLSNYNLKNLTSSPFLANLTENNLVNLNNTKFLLVNISKELHPLLIPKNIDNEEIVYENNLDDFIFIKYPLITNPIMSEENFFSKSSFLIYFKYFINYLITNKYITDIPSLEYEMNKFGINKCFYPFILSKIKFNNSCDIETNNNLASFIKIYILVKLLTKIDNAQFNKNENNDNDTNSDINSTQKTNNYNFNDLEKEIKSETSCGTYNVKNNSKTNIKLNPEKKVEFSKSCNLGTFSKSVVTNRNRNKNINNKDIKTISNFILFILSPKSNIIEINIDDLTQKLMYQCNIYLEKFKKISNKLFSNDVNSLYEAKSFLKSLITSARKNPLIFLRQIENKFNILLNYEIKYCTSICLENFIKYYNPNQIIEKDPKIISYINGEELGFYLIIKNLYFSQIKNKSNGFKRKGNKMVKNISSDNMDICNNNKCNFDNLSILNRSIIQPRNSNFRILNSSKDKPRIKNFNNIHMPTSTNSKSIYSDFSHKNKDCSVLTGNNFSGINSNNGSVVVNLNDNNSVNKNKMSSYKNSQTQSNYKNNDNISLMENIVISSSSSKDMFEFNYDDDSDKSFNVSCGDSAIPSNFNKKRNTTNLNNSKFNLNSNNNRYNSSNSSGNNCKTINAKNYNTNSNSNNINNICLNNIVINSKIHPNNMTPSCSSGLISNHNRVFFGQENRSQFWHSLFNNYHLKFPYNLYKVATQNSKSTSLIYKYLSIYYSFFPFSSNNNYGFVRNINRDSNISNNNPEINISEMLEEQKLILEEIFSNILSVNSKTSYILVHFYFYYFINYYFVESNQIKQCEKIMSKINQIFERNILYKQNNYNIIINILNGLLNDKIDFLKTEKYCSKALILSLIHYGEPRGRNNDGNNIMLFPVWKTGRNCMILDNNEILNENYKELYHCLFYLYDNKRSNKSNLNEIKDSKLIDKNIVNDLYRNVEYIKKIFKKNKKIKVNEINSNNLKNMNYHYDSKSSGESIKNYKKNNSGSIIQNSLYSQNEDSFFNFDDEEMLERPSKVNNVCDEFGNNEEYNINTSINSNNINKKSSINSYNNPFYSSNSNNLKYIDISNNKIIPTINSEYTFEINFRENSTFPDVIFPSMSDKKSIYISSFFSSEKFFIYFVKALFGIINFSQNDLSYTNEYLKTNLISETVKFDNNFGNTYIYSNSSKQKNSVSIFTKILSDNLYYKKYAQSNILVSFGNNIHCETGHKGYKFLSLPRVLYHLKNKEIISIKSGWEHSIAQDKEKMLYSWGNNSCYQCAFESNEASNGNIIFPRNISELNDKNIIEISCGNEHTLALTNKGEVYSWGATSDGVLGREPPPGKENCKGIAKPGKIFYFIKNNIKIRHISSGSIHNLCLDDKSNLYSFGCSKGGQLGLDEDELSIIYKHNQKNKTNIKKIADKEKDNDNEFCVKEPQLIKSLKDLEIIKISSGEAHNAALSIDGKCYVWGFGSNGQLGLGFCEDYFPSGEGMQKSRVFTPTVVKEFDKKNIRISKIFCGKTFTIFLSKKDELYSTGINDLNQCGIDNRTIINEYLCTDIVNPIKIEMFMRMKIINISCGESHVLAITEDNCVKTLFSWGSNRFGQLGQGIQTKQSLPKIVNYFVHYNNSEVFQVSCGAFHSLALLRIKNSENINASSDEKYIFNLIDKCDIYSC